MRFVEVAGASIAVIGAVWAAAWQFQIQVGRIERLEDQIRGFEAKTNATASDISGLKDRVSTLESKAGSTASALAELVRKPPTVVNPIQQQCIELAQQANSGSLSAGIFSEHGENVSRRAVMLMEKLGCGSTVR